MEIERIARPPDEPWDHGPSHEVEPPPSLVVAMSEKRLIAPLRVAARTRDPLEILARAAAHGFAGRARLARAIADLAVTGASASASFNTTPPAARAIASRAAARVGATDDGLLLVHAARALERAEAVAALLCEGREGRARTRLADPDLAGWIAVSGEDDLPLGPVNAPLSPHPTLRATIHVDGHELPVRYAWSGPDEGGQLVVLLHGHSSRLEEYDHLVSALAAIEGPGGEPRYRVAVPDLPGCAYTGRVDHDELEPAGGAEALGFLERFVLAFVHHVCDARGRPRDVAVLGGGSLGGNLSLRLAEECVPWARRFAAWSPASVWSSMEGDLIKGCALSATEERMREEEDEGSRRRYFQEVFADAICGTGRTQPDMWYRDGWAGRPTAVNRALWDRREIYDEAYRRWHWRLAHEQLRFSHVEERLGRCPWHTIEGPMLLVAGAEDNYTWTHIHDRTRDLGRCLSDVPGKTVLIGETGHSIHDERPKLLASLIDDLVRDYP